MLFLLVWIANNILMIIFFLNIHIGLVITLIPFLLDTIQALLYILNRKYRVKPKRKRLRRHHKHITLIAVIHIKKLQLGLEKTIKSIHAQNSDHLHIKIILDGKPKENYMWERKHENFGDFYKDEVTFYSGFVGGVNVLCTKKRKTTEKLIQRYQNGYILFVDQGVLIPQGALETMANVIMNSIEVLSVQPVDVCNWRRCDAKCFMVGTSGFRYGNVVENSIKVHFNKTTLLHTISILSSPCRAIVCVYMLYYYHTYLILAPFLIHPVAYIIHGGVNVGFSYIYMQCFRSIYSRC